MSSLLKYVRLHDHDLRRRDLYIGYIIRNPLIGEGAGEEDKKKLGNAKEEGKRGNIKGKWEVKGQKKAR
jgi:hypothetical protein